MDKVYWIYLRFYILGRSGSVIDGFGLFMPGGVPYTEAEHAAAAFGYHDGKLGTEPGTKANLLALVQSMVK